MTDTTGRPPPARCRAPGDGPRCMPSRPNRCSALEQKAATRLRPGHGGSPATGPNPGRCRRRPSPRRHGRLRCRRERRGIGGQRQHVRPPTRVRGPNEWQRPRPLDSTSSGFRWHELPPACSEWVRRYGPLRALSIRAQYSGPLLRGTSAPTTRGASLGLEIGCSARPSRKRPEGFAPVKDSPASLPQHPDGKQQQEQPPPGLRVLPSVAGVDDGVEGAGVQPRGSQAFVGH